MEQATAASKTIVLGTDIASFMVFHPKDLTDHADWPIAWYSEAFAYAPLSRAGHLLVFDTGSDGRYSLRLVYTPEGGNPLSEEENAQPVRRHHARFEVRHGAVFLDNGDALPHEDARGNLEKETERRLDLPNGLYRITIHDIDLSELGKTRKLTYEDIDFVLSFTPVTPEEFEQIPASVVAPRMRPAGENGQLLNADALHDASLLSAHQSRLLLRSESIEEVDKEGFDTSPLVLPVPGAMLLPGEVRTFEVPNAWALAVSEIEHSWEKDIVVAPSLDEGAGITLTHVDEMSWSSSKSETAEPATVYIRASFITRMPGSEAITFIAPPEPPEKQPPANMFVRLLGRKKPPSAPETRLMCIALPEKIEPLSPPEGPALPDAIVDDLRRYILTVLERDAENPILGRHPPSYSYEAAQIAAVDRAEALVDWLLSQLDIPAPTRMQLFLSTYEERLKGCCPYLEKVIGHVALPF